MRTTVYVDEAQAVEDEGDEWPGSSGSVQDTGDLVVVDHDTSGVVETYGPGEWHSFTTTAD